jgi:hypothetical protein
MDYEIVKAAMKKLGHQVSEAGTWNHKDIEQFNHFCHFTLGYPWHKAHEILTYPLQFPEIIAKIISIADVTPKDKDGPQEIKVAEPAKKEVQPSNKVEAKDSNIFDATPKG